MATNNATNTPVLTANGQLMIGSSGANPVAATLTAGTGISITNGAGTITITNTGGSSTTWTTVTTTTQTLAANNGYVANDASLITFTLPTTAAVGDTYEIIGLGAGGYIVAQNASQLVHFGNTVTTTGTGGSVASTNQYDSLTIKCIVANTTFSVRGPVGNFTIV